MFSDMQMLIKWLKFCVKLQLYHLPLLFVETAAFGVLGILCLVDEEIKEESTS
jgi:hypothetical protein